MNDKNGAFVVFLAGMLVGGFAGVIVTLFTAPQSGEETRKQVRTKSIELRDAAEQTMDETLTTLRTAADDMISRTEEFRAQSQAAMAEAQKQWEAAIKDIKEVALEAIEESKATAEEAVAETVEVATETE